MSFMDHLMELRSRLVVCLVALVVTSAAAWAFHEELFGLVRGPLDHYNASAPPEARVRFIGKELAEPFVFVMWLGIWGGLLLASPVIAWEAWRFVSPGLYRRERRVVLAAFVMGAFFFAGGAAFAYRFVMPAAVGFLAPYGAKLGAEMMLTLSGYLGFFVTLHAAFGLAFETPLVVLVLALFGVVTARGLLRRWKYAVAGAFILGAVLTPPDVASQVMMAGCLVALYLLSVVLALAFGRRAGREAGAAKDAP
jgi:sec-independent protein translocase protein TatC